MKKGGRLTCTVTGPRRRSTITEGGLEVPCSLSFEGPPELSKKFSKVRCTVYDRIDAAATINFSTQFGAATIRERRLFESGVYFVRRGYRLK